MSDNEGKIPTGPTPDLISKGIAKTWTRKVQYIWPRIDRLEKDASLKDEAAVKTYIAAIKKVLNKLNFPKTQEWLISDLEKFCTELSNKNKTYPTGADLQGPWRNNTTLYAVKRHANVLAKDILKETKDAMATPMYIKKYGKDPKPLQDWDPTKAFKLN